MSETAAQTGAARRSMRTAIVVVTAAALVALLIALPFIATALHMPALTGLATRIAILALAAVSLNLALGYGGLVSFGHAAYYGVGAYAVGILTQAFTEGETVLFGIPGTDQLLITLPIAMLAAALAAAVFGALSLRTSGVQFIMITLAFAQMLFFLFVALKAYGGDDGLILRRRNALPLLDTRKDATFYYICLVLLALWTWLIARLVHSPFGRTLDGLRQNPRRMAAIGVAAYPHQLTAFIVAGAGAGLAGGLMANFGKFVSPDMLHWTQSGEFLIMVILGGVGTVTGPAVGAAILIVLESVLASWTEHWQVILGPLLVLIVLIGHKRIAAFASSFMRRADG